MSYFSFNFSFSFSSHRTLHIVHLGPKRQTPINVVEAEEAAFFFLSFLFHLFLPNHFRYRMLLLHLITLNDTHKPIW
jgi:hypothetical protein